MKIYILLLFELFFIHASSQDPVAPYPTAPGSQAKDNIWDTIITDQYRALEIDNADRDSWIDKEEEITQSYFKGKEYKHLGFHPVSGYRSIPMRSGPYYLTQNNGLLYYMDYLRDEVRTLYDARTTGNTTTSFSSYAASDDGKYCALMYAPEASDWQEIKVYNFNTSFLTKDHIRNVKHSGIYWHQNGFYYCRYDSVIEAKKNTQVERFQRVYYHIMGTDSRQDSLIFDDPANPDNTFTIATTPDKRFIIITEEFPDENRRMMFYKDDQKNGGFKSLLTEKNSTTSILGHAGDTLIALTTNGGSSNGKIVEIDTKDALNWSLILDNQKLYRIKDAYYYRDTIAVIFQQSFYEYIALISRSGKLLQIKPLRVGSSNSIVCFSPDQNSFIIRQSLDVCPDVGLLFSLTDYSVKPIFQFNLRFNPGSYEYYVTNYISKDSTRVPIFMLTLKENFRENPQPVLLNIDGTFGRTPGHIFNPNILSFLDNGGLYAIADIRGGSNSEKSWRQLGTGFAKQNAIDDIYYATKFLTDSGFAISDKIAVSAGEYASVAVAAAINQHPETFRVALFTNGMFDLLRYEKFTSGKRAVKEFGSVADDIQFQNILSIDPIQNIKPGLTYPSVYLTGSKLYNRIPPLHSYKYLASLQKMTTGKHPILLYMVNGSGWTGYDTEKRYDRFYGYYYKFLFDELGMKNKYINYTKSQY